MDTTLAARGLDEIQQPAEFRIVKLQLRKKYRGGKVTTKNVLKGIAKNPIIVATVVALAFRIVGISEFPEFVDLSISSIAALTTPMALLFLGLHHAGG